MHMDLRATRDPGDVVRDISLDVHHRAEFGPGFVGMVVLATSLPGQEFNGVRREY